MSNGWIAGLGAASHGVADLMVPRLTRSGRNGGWAAGPKDLDLALGGRSEVKSGRGGIHKNNGQRIPMGARPCLHEREACL